MNQNRAFTSGHAPLENISDAIESKLLQLLPRESELSQELVDGMRYATLGGGKRIRGSLVCATTLCLEAPMHNGLYIACAVECMHAYSLVHDDLPAMDDASLRRGKPSCHKQFGEAMAILIGDGLQALAIELICSAPNLQTDQKLTMLQIVSVAVGSTGMVGGQAMDVKAETLPRLSLDELNRLQQAKTGMLISAAVKLGCLAAGEPLDSYRTAALTRFGDLLGRAFQIADDLLDIQPSSVTGKPPDLDADHDKQTFLSALGEESARAEVQKLLKSALAALDECDGDSALLRELADCGVNRFS